MTRTPGLVDSWRCLRATMRLRAHMHARLLHGGTPECPCGRCVRDKALLATFGKTWDEPESNAWLAEHRAKLDEATAAARQRSVELREPDAELDPYRTLD